MSRRAIEIKIEDDSDSSSPVRLSKTKSDEIGLCIDGDISIKQIDHTELDVIEEKIEKIA